MPSRSSMIFPPLYFPLEIKNAFPYLIIATSSATTGMFRRSL
jgi:hypothetical protein